MTEHRSTAAGIFYPGDYEQLVKLLDETPAADGDLQLPAAVLVPHAAYEFMLAPAARAFCMLSARQPERIILLSPLHREVLGEDFPAYLFTPPADAFATPLGPVSCDRTLQQELLEGAGDHGALRSSYFEEEPGWELPLPLLQHLWGEITLLPVLFGGTKAKETALLARVLDQLTDERTLVIISSNAAAARDGETAGRQAAALRGMLLGEDPPDLLEARRDGLISSCGTAVLDGLYKSRRITDPWTITSGPHASPDGGTQFLSAAVGLSGGRHADGR